MVTVGDSVLATRDFTLFFSTKGEILHHDKESAIVKVTIVVKNQEGVEVLHKEQIASASIEDLKRKGRDLS